MKAKEIELSGRSYKLTRKALVRDAYERYLHCCDEKLRDVYGRYSDEKEKAYEKCKKFYKDNSKEEIHARILSHCSNFFTCGAVIILEDGSAYFVYDTPSNKYVMKIK
jgi:hypothetical protein